MEPVHPQATGTGTYLHSWAVVDIAVLAYTAKPLVPVIELVFDSLAAPTDDPSVQPLPFVADSVYTSSQSTLTYPSPTTSSAATSDQESSGVRKKVVDAQSVSDSVATDLSGPPAPQWSATTDWTLTNGNLTGNYGGVGGNNNLFANFSQPTTSGTDYTFTVTLDVLPGGASVDVGVALDQASQGLTAGGGNNTSAGVDAAGDVLYSSWTTGGNVGRALAQGDVIHVRIKDGYAYWNLNGGAWVGVTTGADPATNTGGVPISGWGAQVYPVTFSQTSGQQFTAAF